MANIYSEENRNYGKYQFLWRTSESNRNKLKILSFNHKTTMSLMLDYLINDYWEYLRNNNKTKS